MQKASDEYCYAADVKTEPKDAMQGLRGTVS